MVEGGDQEAASWRFSRFLLTLEYRALESPLQDNGKRKRNAMDRGQAARMAPLIAPLSRRQSAKGTRFSFVRLLQGVTQATNRLLTAREFTPGMNDALAMLGEAAAVDRLYVFEHHLHPVTGTKAFTQRYEWVQHGMDIEITNPLVKESTYNTRWYDTLLAGIPIGGPVKHFPKAERHFLNPHSVLSLLLVPLTVDGRFWGFLGCEDCHTARRWSADEEAALLTLATAIGTVIERQHAEEALRHSEERLRFLSDHTFDLITQDITQRRQTEEALRESEEKYRDLVENINDVIYAQDEHGVMTYISPVVKPLSGYSPNEIIGRPFIEFIYAEDLPALMASFQRTIAGQLEPSEFRVVTKSGELRWARSSSRPVFRENHIVGLQGVLTDITERKQAELRTQALLDIAKDISGTLDLHELLDRVQRQTAIVLPCDIVATFYWDPGKEAFRLISQHGIPVELLPDAQALAFPPDQPFGGRLTNGQTVTINDIVAQSWLSREFLAHFQIVALVAAPLRVHGRHLGAFLACTTTNGRRFDTYQVELCRGIAQQLAVGIEAAGLYKQQQEDAAASSMLARVSQEMIASLNIPTVLEHLCRLTAEALGDPGGCTLLWQARGSVYTPVASWGFTSEQQETIRVLQIPGEAITDLITLLKEKESTVVESVPTADAITATLLQEFGLKTLLFLSLRQGQDLIGFQSWSAPEPRELTARHHRLTQSLSQIASLVLANASLFTELQEANRVKDDFVSTMSHELRTPLSIIIGYSDLLKEDTFGPLDAPQTDTVRRIEKAARELLDLINATLDLSRLQSQHVPLTLVETNVVELLAELETESRHLNQKGTVDLFWQVPATLPRLHTDRVKLKMVLKNLITNALKFTYEGRVSVTASPHKGGVEFCVSDTGIGIPQNALPIIFEPFRQVDSSPSRRHGGVGLGLYIVRQLLKLLGGTIAVESEVEKGSCFRVWMPSGLVASPLKKRPDENLSLPRIETCGKGES